MKSFFWLIILNVLLFGTGYSQSIAGGYSSSLFLCNDGTVRSSGWNNNGQLGDGTTTDRNTPIVVSGLSNITNVDNGLYHSVYLKDDGTVWTCGSNLYGQLGIGSNTNRDVPVRIPGLSGVTAIAAGAYHTLFLKSDSTVWACGLNGAGRLGDGTTTDRTIPVRINGISKVVAIAAASHHSLFLKNDGTVWTCGSNTNGQGGLGSVSSNNVPVRINSMSNVVAIAAGSLHSLMVKGDGTVWSCGSNQFGQLGIGTNIDSNIPTIISGLLGVAAVSAGLEHSLFLKSNGTVRGCGKNTFGQLGNGTTVNSNTPLQANGLTGVIAIATGHVHSIFMKSDGTAWVCGNNELGQLADGTETYINSIPFFNPNLCTIMPPVNSNRNRILGYTYSDFDEDCYRQGASEGIPLVGVRAVPGNHYIFADETGFFALGINDSVSYTIQPIIPQLLAPMLQSPCPAQYEVSLTENSPPDTSGFDFGFEVSPCHLLRVAVGENRKRRCFNNSTVVSYWNEGLMPANNVELRVKFAQYDIPVSSSQPFTWDSSDSSLVFLLGTLNPNQSGSVYITDSVACLQGITGLTQCTKAWILPVNQCYLDLTEGNNWDHSAVEVTGSCIQDTCVFVIENAGTGNMASASAYRIYANNMLNYTGSIQLNSGAVQVIKNVSEGATIRLEVDQSLGHPGISHPRATVEGCGLDGFLNLNAGLFDQVSQDDAAPDIAISCLRIIDSYDPNMKVSSPTGIGAQRIILRNTPVRFTIHFQNTGTDTAYKVVVVDTLSNDYDLSTLELGASSHTFTSRISGDGKAVLTFTFNHINLVDSITNEPLSHGFVNYTISPKSDVPLGTQIDNLADIYFDYNLPVRTNNAFVTLGEYDIVTNIKEHQPTANVLRVFPNPTNGMLTFESSATIHRIVLYSVDGKRVKEIAVSNLVKTGINISELSQGIYFAEIYGDNMLERVKVLRQ